MVRFHIAEGAKKRRGRCPGALLFIPYGSEAD